jgi:hypothetical protein
MTTIGELILEAQFEREYGRAPTEAERAELNARMNIGMVKYQASLTPEQRKDGEEFAADAMSFITRVFGVKK